MRNELIMPHGHASVSLLYNSYRFSSAVLFNIQYVVPLSIDSISYVTFNFLNITIGCWVSFYGGSLYRVIYHLAWTRSLPTMAEQQTANRWGKSQGKYETDELSISTEPHIWKRATVRLFVCAWARYVSRERSPVCAFVLFTKPLLEILLFRKCKLSLGSSFILKYQTVYFSLPQSWGQVSIYYILLFPNVEKHKCVHQRSC